MTTLNIMVLGGTGLISTGITKACMELGHNVIHFNRGNNANIFEVETIRGDRNDCESLKKAAEKKPDVVIDMLCFNAAQAQTAIDAFAAKTGQYIYCSTFCVYNLIEALEPIKETSPASSHTEYGANKFAAEMEFLKAAQKGFFETTIFRPSHIYGEDFFVNQLDFEGARFLKCLYNGAPVLLGDSGISTWQACHRDDAGIAFANAAGREKCFGKTYNLSYREIMSWRTFYERAAKVLGREAVMVTLPAADLLEDDNGRFEFYRDITRFHCALDTEKVYNDIPEFHQRIQFEDGVKMAWERVEKKCGTDLCRYNSMNSLINKATPLIPKPKPYNV
ncbi:MAG: NAD-dependent epimerase/dehydratase family protein [Clostridia bacterium]|nr:NAD-dependent epimerase/dehydratase family protein [Clostridia bacterium]